MHGAAAESPCLPIYPTMSVNPVVVYEVKSPVFIPHVQSKGLPKEIKSRSCIIYLEAIYDFHLGKKTQLLQCIEIFRNRFSVVDPNIKWCVKSCFIFYFFDCFPFLWNQNLMVCILIQCFTPSTNTDRPAPAVKLLQKICFEQHWICTADNLMVT